MSKSGAGTRVLTFVALAGLISGCGDVVDLIRENIDRGPRGGGGDGGIPAPPPTPSPPPALPTCTTNPLPAPVPGFEQCPAAGSACAPGLPPLLPCGIGGHNAVVACQTSATGQRTWKVEHIACPQPECVSDVPPPPPPGTGACPPVGSPCPGNLPPALLCNVQQRDAFMLCQPSGWRLEAIECP